MESISFFQVSLSYVSSSIPQQHKEKGGKGMLTRPHNVRFSMRVTLLPSSIRSPSTSANVSHLRHHMKLAS